MKKIILLFITLVPLSVVGLALYAMSTDDVEGIVICATNDETSYIPSSVCEYYLFNFRLTKNDIKFLENRGGLNFPIGISDKAKRYKLVKYFISKGVSVNKPSAIDGYPPLHATIINNDPDLVTLLLDNGADIDQKDTNHSLTAEEFVEFLLQKQPSIDRSSIKKIISLRKV